MGFGFAVSVVLAISIYASVAMSIAWSNSVAVSLALIPIAKYTLASGIFSRVVLAFSLPTFLIFAFKHSVKSLHKLSKLSWEKLRSVCSGVCRADVSVGKRVGIFICAAIEFIALAIHVLGEGAIPAQGALNFGVIPQRTAEILTALLPAITEFLIDFDFIQNQNDNQIYQLFSWLGSKLSELRTWVLGQEVNPQPTDSPALTPRRWDAPDQIEQPWVRGGLDATRPRLAELSSHRRGSNLRFFEQPAADNVNQAPAPGTGPAYSHPG